ncbi:MAG: tRNA-binding protein [Patescibacteria group bacterium]
MITFEDFEKVDIRVGKIISVEDFPEALKPAYKLTIDFKEEIGTKMSSAQFVKAHPKKEDLLGKLVLCVVNFLPKRIGPFTSEVLTLGVPDKNGNWVAVSPIKGVPLGGKLG